MTGSNWTAVTTGAGGLNSISVDSSGTVFLGGGGAKLLVNMSWLLPSSGTIGPLGLNTVAGVTAVPLPSSRPAALTISTTTLAFSNQTVGTTSTPQPVIVTNIGGTPLNFSNIAVTSGFVDTTDCSAILNAGASCTASVAFAPSLSGPATGTLTFMDDSSNLGSMQVVSLTGNGVSPPPPVVVSTRTILGAPSTPQVVGSAVTLTATVQATTGTPTGSVAFLDGATTLGTGTLDTHSTATYTTSTLAAGTHSITAQYGGSLSFAASTSAVAQVVVTGMPDYSGVANSSSLTIAAGSTGTSTLTITPANGYAGTITFACGALPANASCSFSSKQVTFAANETTPQTTVLTIGTQLQALGANQVSGTGNGLRLALAFGLPLYTVSIFALRRRSLGRLRTVLTLVCLLTLISLTGPATGCAGGAARPATSLSVGPGVYAIPITISGGSTSHSINLSLTVN